MNRLSSSPRFRLRSRTARLASIALAVGLVGSACGGAAGEGDPGSADGSAVTPSETPAGDTATERPDGGEAEVLAIDPGSSLAGLVSELPPAPVGFPDVEAVEARPVALTIESLGIDRAPIIGVGVESSGALEVPPADEVGWYRYSPVPGQSGSSILAAHIAFDGQNGVFVGLADVDPGATVEVVDEDGTTSRFAVESIEQYDKEALPDEVVFAREGDPRLILVTCGGRFDPERNSYDDNIVVVATPIEPVG